MLRTISILVLLVCSAANMAESKPIFLKVLAPIGGYSSGSYRSTVATAPVNNQLISSLISSKIQLLNSVLQAKSSAGGYSIGFNKIVTFSSTTTTEKPVTHHTTEVNTDFTPDDSSISTTQLVYTTTTEGAVETPSPTIRPEPPSTSTTAVIPIKSTTVVPEVTTTTTANSGYTYRTPTSGPATSSVDLHYVPAPPAQGSLQASIA
ncbi:LOW QUALITY PROTEIN: cell wall integrity and stress response component 2 [Drosophila rhopaloa]|uniref:Uncharacterized protein n=1 Tax=Drosophila rhopaloa TaxID=1041015 RepID=A0ABM5H4H4_DRORH|nr:LOW QUALITY PROTEIN: cell wall integrity and stress response component 2 [Drosophila rhopaloa]